MDASLSLLHIDHAANTAEALLTMAGFAVTVLALVVAVASLSLADLVRFVDPAGEPDR